MKPKGPGLGTLSSRFFAYAQLKKLEIVRTGEIATVLGIKGSQKGDLFRRLSSSGWIVRLKRGVYLVPSRIPAGGKYSPGAALIPWVPGRSAKGTINRKWGIIVNG